MTEKAESPTRNFSSFLVMMILIILVLSFGALYLAVDAVIRENNAINAWYFMLIGLIGLSLSAYMLLQTKRRSLGATFEMPRVITTILCQKCGFKNVRDFQRGDYVFKETESCPKCSEKMMIASIYREVSEKEK